MPTQLTPAQHAILAHAHEHTEGKVTWFPDNIKGGARQKVIDGLSRRALISSDGKDWFIAADGYEALGLPHRAPPSKQAQVIAMLRSADGATIMQICEATGWQPHYADVLVMPISAGNPTCAAESAVMKSA